MFKYRKSICHFAVVLGTVLTASVALSNPQGGIVTSGGANISSSGNTTTINQSSQQAIIQWNSFNIAAHEKTQFIQPNSSSVALNRINPQQGASQIYGQLTSNGRIILINGAGIFFGPSARVDVGGLIASTADITNANFLAGKYIFDQPSNFHGSIINEGKIIAANYGLVALMGDSVSNTGVIRARLGSIVLGSGSLFTLDFNGDQLINFSVNGSSSTASTGVYNSGKLLADGGQILVTAKAAAGVLDNVIDMKGVAETHSVAEHGGEIILSGGNYGTVVVSGKLNASGRGRHSKGGTIEITGNTITLASTAVLDASGTIGGGNIFVGGNEHGVGPLQDANTTTVSAGATLNASATKSGNGGNVIVWSNDLTSYAGTILAKGGVLSGNGGFSEVSGHTILDFNKGIVNLTAAHGAMGTLLLDPENVTIETGTTTGGTLSGGTFTPNANGSILSVTDLENALATSNVNVLTTGSGTDVGDITVANSLTWNSTSTLTLTASNNIYLNANISASKGGLTLTAGSASDLITSGAEGSASTTGVTASLTLANFNLTQGNWTQVNTTNLPTFTVSNNFQLNTGVMPSSNITFIRAVGGTGSSGSPYQIADIYGLQGMGSNSTTLADHFILANDIDGTGTTTWNSGAGFVPIGNATTAFTGALNGEFFTINGLFVNQSTSTSGPQTFSGLFGETGNGPTGAGTTISNLGLSNVNFTGFFAGGIVAEAIGNTTLSDDWTSGSVTASANSAGLVATAGFVISVYISNSYSTVTARGSFVGGLAGTLYSGSITNSYAAGTLIGQFGDGGLLAGLSTYTTSFTISDSYSSSTFSNPSGTLGGILGVAGFGTTLTNDYWDTSKSGVTVAYDVSAGSTATTNNVKGGCIGGGSCGVDLGAQATYTGFNFTTPWAIVAGNYPTLSVFPNMIGGMAPGVGAGVNNVSIYQNGTLLNTASTNAAGGFNYQASSGVVTGDSLLFVLGTGSSNAVTLVTDGKNNNANINVSLLNDTLQIGDNNTNTISDSQISTAIGSLSSTSVIFSDTGSGLTLGNASNTAVNLVTSPTTTYSVSGISYASGASGNLTFNGPVSVAAASTSITGNSVAFNSTVDGATSGSDTLTINASQVNFSGNVGSATSLNTLSIPSGAVDTSTITITASTLINIGATLDDINAAGTDNLALTSAAITLNQNVGVNSAFKNFTLTGATQTGNGSSTLEFLATTSIAVNGSLSAATAGYNLELYSPTVDLSGNVGSSTNYYNNFSTAANASGTAGAVFIGAGLTMYDPTISLNGTVDSISTTAFALTLEGTLLNVFGNVGSTHPLSTLTLELPASQIGTAQFGSSTFNTSSVYTVKTSGNQLYSIPVVGVNSVTFTVTSGNINFADPLGITNNVSLGTSTGVTLNGFSSSPNNFSVTGGAATLNGSSYAVGNNASFAGPVTISSNMTIDAPGTITFNNTISGSGLSLILNSAGNTLNNNVGTSGAPLSALTLEDFSGNGTGSDSIGTSSIFTTGAQQFSNSLSISGTATLSSTTGSITFSNPINGSSANTGTLSIAGQSLSLETSVGATNALGTLKINIPNAAGDILLNSASTINVKNFTLTQGEWIQDAATLPAFAVATNFTIGAGSAFNNVFNGEFERITGGTGSSTSPYLISDIYGLQGIATMPISATTDYYSLTNNISSTSTSAWNGGTGFAPIGEGTLATGFFQGVFNGGDFTITGITSVYPVASSNTGLFGVVDNGTVENVGLISPIVTGGTAVGGLAGTVEGTSTITNDYVRSGTITGFTGVGGLVGVNNASAISDSYSTGSVVGIKSSTTISSLIGGFVGNNIAGTIANSYTTSNVTNTDLVSSQSSAGIGGFVGENTGTISTSYSAGTITVSATISSDGAFAGLGASTYVNDFYNSTTAGLTSAVGGATNVNVNPLTTTQMQGNNNFTNFDFTSISANSGIWAMPSSTSINNGYPVLTGSTPGPYAGLSRTISGQVVGGNNDSISFYVNGILLTTVVTNSTGVYSFNTSTATSGGDLLAYVTTSGYLGSAITLVPAGLNTIANLNITQNQVSVGDANSNALSNADLVTAAGSISNSSILYSTSGNNIPLALTGNNIVLNSGVSLSTSATTTYTINAGITGSGNIAFSGPVTVSGSPTVSTSAGSINVASTLDGNSAVTFSSTTGTTISGAIGGATPLTTLTISGSGSGNISNITGLGTLTITGGSETVSADSANSAITVSGGTLITNGNNDLGNNTITLSGGALSSSGAFTLANALNITSASNITGTNALTLSGTITGSGSLNLQNTNTVTISGASSGYAGNVILTSGTLAVGASTSLGGGNIEFSGGTLKASTTGISLSNTFSIDTGVTGIVGGTNAITLLGNGTLNNTGTASILSVTDTAGATFSGAISGGGGVSLGTGITGTFNGSNTYTGTTAVTGTLDISGGTSTLSGLLSGAGTVNVSGGSTTFSNTSANTFNGAMNLSGGTLIAGGATNALGVGVLTLSGGTLASSLTGVSVAALGNSSWGVTGNAQIGGSGNLTLSNSGTITKSFTLSVTNSANTIFSNAITPATTGGTGSTTNIIINNTTGNAIFNGANTFTSLEFTSGEISSGSNGTTLLAAYSVDTGATGAVGGSNTITLSGVGTLNNTGTASILTIADTAAATFSAAISGGGGVSVSTGGIATFTNNDTYTGPIAVAGTLNITAGTDTLSGLLSGSGTVNVSAGSVTLGSSSGNTFNGAMKFSGGTLIAGAATNALGVGVLTLSGGLLESSLTGVNVATLGNSSWGMTASTQIGGSGNITFSNAGTITKSFTLAVTNTANTIFGGAITPATTGGVGTVTTITINNTATGNTAFSGANTFTNLTLTSGEISSASAGTTLSAAFVVPTGVTATVGGSNTITMSGNGILSGVGILSVTDSAAATFGSLSSSGSVSVSSGGIATFNGSNSYTGSTNVAGTLNITATDTVGFLLSGAGTVNVSGGTVTFSHAGNTFNGTMNLSGGTLVAGVATNALGVGVLTLSGGILETNLTGASIATLGNSSWGVTGNAQIGGSGNITITNAGTITNGAALTITNSANTIFSSAITPALTGGTGNTTSIIINNTTGDAVFNGANTFTSLEFSSGEITSGTTGTTLAAAFSVDTGVTGTVGGSKTITISGNGTLNNTGTASILSITDTAGASFGGAISGDGGISISTGVAGTFSGSNTYTGTTAVAGTLDITGGTSTLSGLLSGAGTVNVSGGSMTFSNSSANTFNGPMNLSGGTLIAGGPTNALGGGVLTISGGILASSLTGANVAVLGNSSWTVTGNAQIGGSGNITLSNAGTVAKGSTLTVSNSANTIFTHAIGVASGTGSTDNIIINNTTGNAVFNGNNTVTNMELSSGQVSSGSAGTMMQAIYTVDAGATVTIGGSNSITFASAGTLNSATSALDITNTGTTNLNSLQGAANGDGQLNSTGSSVGVITLGPIGTIFSLASVDIVNGVSLNGTVQTSGAQTLSGAVTLGTSSTLTTTGSGAIQVGSVTGNGNNLDFITAGNSSISGIFSDGSAASSLTQSGSGNLTLDSQNTYTGTTTVNSGTLTMGVANAISSSSAVSVNNIGTFDLANFNQNIGSLASNSAVSNAVKLGSATLTLGNNNSSTSYSGVITDIVLGSSAGGSITKVGTGNFTENGLNPNTYSGTTTATGGILQVNSSNLLGSAAVQINSGGQLKLAPTVTSTFSNAITDAGMLNDAGTGLTNIVSNLTLAGGSINVSVATETLKVTNALSGTSGFEKDGAGTLTLSAANTYSGITTIAAGILDTSIANALSSSSDINITGATAEWNLAGNNQAVSGLSGSGIVQLGSAILTINNNASYTYSGVIEGSGGVTIAAGSNSETFSGVNTYTGITNINSGTLKLSSAGTLAASSVVNVAANSTFALASASLSNTVDLNGGGITATGTSNLSGAVNVNSDAVVSTSTSTDKVSFSGTVSGAGSLDLEGAGVVSLNNTTSVNSVTSNAGKTVVKNVSTTGSQTYNGAVAIASNATLSTTGNGNIELNDGVNGDFNLTVNGGTQQNNTVIFKGSVAVNNITVNGGSATNSLAVQTGDAQTWNITGANIGNITGISEQIGSFNFNNIAHVYGSQNGDTFQLAGGSIGAITGGTGNNTIVANNIANTFNITGVNSGSVTDIASYTSIQNLVGGSATNNFVFANNSGVTGSINGGSSAGNTIDYSAYSNPITLTLAANNAGNVANNYNVMITGSFSNIQNAVGTGASTLNITSNSANTVTFTGSTTAFVNDPTNISGFTTINNTGNGTTEVIFISGNEAVFTSPNTANINNGPLITFGPGLTFSGDYTGLQSNVAPQYASSSSSSEDDNAINSIQSNVVNVVNSPTTNNSDTTPLSPQQLSTQSCVHIGGSQQANVSVSIVDSNGQIVNQQSGASHSGSSTGSDCVPVIIKITL